MSTSCPINYRTSPSLLASSPPIHEPSALYVVGGLYGNLQALQFIENLTSSHSSPPTVIYNGDFHFFDKRPKTFDSVQRSIVDSESVLATAGNVEKEIASLDSTSCGCDYPEYTDFKVTERSDAIVGRLKKNAEPHAENLLNLPLFRRVEMPNTKVGVIHGDCNSLSGWDYAVENVEPVDVKLRADLNMRGDYPVTSVSRIVEDMEAADVDILCCTHTCLPYMQDLGGGKVIVNNGSAGMGNFEGDKTGLITRIVSGDEVGGGGEVVYEIEVGGDRGCRVQSVKVDFDFDAFWEEFSNEWEEGSPARESYEGRIWRGVGFWSADRARRMIE
ncbi:hypothetical protein TL16_g02357 [Triparma laevis f. inornata]|uniref:Calcineurin-like phosphoesterase domain-containing protein n=1 Tax=Triparma laevis f. inornata TaxID=1714386 RepID=A0A9W7DWD9_9STRA|nr:hypothetical protein TL16_g02357 [Triparma laevis f. inornata]